MDSDYTNGKRAQSVSTHDNYKNYQYYTGGVVAAQWQKNGNENFYIFNDIDFNDLHIQASGTGER